VDSHAALTIQSKKEGFYETVANTPSITSPGGTASASIRNNVTASAWVGNSNNEHWGGEFRYSYQRGDLRLNQGSTQASFSSDSHAMSYDLLYHFKDREYQVRPFVAFGGGIQTFRGTGQEVLVQPLSNIALLTKAQDLVPMASVAAGFKVQLSAHAQLRVDVHNYVTPFPKQVIVPFNGSVGRLMNNIVPMVGISWTK
jgi:hypothetical protein